MRQNFRDPNARSRPRLCWGMMPFPVRSIGTAPFGPDFPGRGSVKWSKLALPGPWGPLRSNFRSNPAWQSAGYGNSGPSWNTRPRDARCPDDNHARVGLPRDDVPDTPAFRKSGVRLSTCWGSDSHDDPTCIRYRLRDEHEDVDGLDIHRAQSRFLPPRRQPAQHHNQPRSPNTTNFQPWRNSHTALTMPGSCSRI